MTNRTDVPAAGNNPEIPPVTSPIRVKLTIKKKHKTLCYQNVAM